MLDSIRIEEQLPELIFNFPFSQHALPCFTFPIPRQVARQILTAPKIRTRQTWNFLIFVVSWIIREKYS